MPAHGTVLAVVVSAVVLSVSPGKADRTWTFLAFAARSRSWPPELLAPTGLHVKKNITKLSRALHAMRSNKSSEFPPNEVESVSNLAALSLPVSKNGRPCAGESDTSVVGPAAPLFLCVQQTMPTEEAIPPVMQA